MSKRDPYAFSTPMPFDKGNSYFKTKPGAAPLFSGTHEQKRRRAEYRPAAVGHALQKNHCASARKNVARSFIPALLAAGLSITNSVLCNVRQV
jgi:hypothetical protein